MEFKPYLNFQAQKSHATKSQYGFRNNSICLTKIPKNACTSLLNAFIRLEGKTNVWFEMGTRIHEVAQRWCVEQSELVFFDPRISVIVFRDPALRLYSSFIDKLVNHDLSRGNFDAFFLRALGKTPENLRISEVVNASNSIPAFLLNEHFAPQYDFIFFKEYTHVITLTSEATLDQIVLGDEKIPIGSHNSSSPNHNYYDEDVSLKEARDRFKIDQAVFSKQFFCSMYYSHEGSKKNFYRDLMLWSDLQGGLKN